MNFNDPIKSKNLFVTFLIFSIVFVLSSGILGYLYYRTNRNLQSANTDKQNLTNQYNDLKTASANIDAIIQDDATNKSQNAVLNKQNETYKGQIKDYQNQITKVSAYNDFYKYMNSVIQLHGSFTGWTAGEQSQASTLADKTNDDNLKNDVNTYWIDTTPAPQTIAAEITRMLHFWDDIASGIDKSVQQ